MDLVSLEEDFGFYFESTNIKPSFRIIKDETPEENNKRFQLNLEKIKKTRKKKKNLILKNKI